MTEKRKAGKRIKIDVRGEEKETDQVQSDSDEQESEKEVAWSGDPLEDMKVELEKTLQEAKDNYDRFLRVSAEFENYKKRSAREIEDFRKYANERLIKDLLPVIDNLERAIDSSESGDKASGSIVEGIHLTLQEILKVLERFNVLPIETLGKAFDPAFHQAVMQEDTDNGVEPKVLKEFQRGYMLHDRLLRPAMVVVSKARETRDDTGDNPEEKSEDKPEEQNHSETN